MQNDTNFICLKLDKLIKMTYINIMDNYIYFIFRLSVGGRVGKLKQSEVI